MIFRSQTYGNVELEEIPFKLNEFYKRNKHWGSQFNIIIGTDSQNHDYTKVVTVIAITCSGHGGIYFDHVKKINRISNVKEKLNYETGDSLLVATKLLEIFEDEDELAELYLNSHLAVHIDAGTNLNGKTYMLLKDLIGWVTATGFDCKIKPDSFVASSIADKISK